MTCKCGRPAIYRFSRSGHADVGVCAEHVADMEPTDWWHVKTLLAETPTPPADAPAVTPGDSA